jgi:hypothetical protein
MSNKNFNDRNENQNRDHPAYSAVPLPTAPPRAPHKLAIWEDKFTAGFIPIKFESVKLINLAHNSNQ